MKKMSKGMLMTALICGAVYLGGSPVYASELQEFSLDEYVVTAARTETKLVDTPANITVVDAQTIEDRHYQDVSEVLKDVPGANVLDSGQGAYEKAISLNGDTRVLVLVDGRRVDFASGTSTGSANFDLNMLPNVSLIEKIEILKGAGGALYGSDAVGGVINIITKKADNNFGKVSVAMGSMGTEDYSAIYSYKQGKTGVSVSASKYEQDYYKYKDAATASTKRWPGDSSFENEKVSLKLDYEISKDVVIEAGYDYSKYEGLSSGSINNIVSNNQKETNNIYSKLNWTINGSDMGYLQFYHNEYSYDSIKADKSEVYSNLEEETNGLDLQQSFSLGNNNKVVLGMSWRDSEVNNPGHYDSGIENLAIFINDTWEFLPTWTLNAGVRYDDHSQAGDETTMSAGLNKKINDDSHAYIHWGQVFKAPSTGDLFNYDEAGGCKTIGNRNLKAETGDTWTVGYNTKLSSNTQLGINVFKSDLKDAIDWVGFDYDPSLWGGWGGYKEYRALNVNKQKKRGMELSLDHIINDNVSVNATYTYIRVKDDYGTGYFKDFKYVPNTYRLGINYKDGKWNSNLWVRLGSGCSNQEYLDDNYLTLDCAITYNATNNLSIFAKGYNLLNESYAEYGGHNGSSYSYPAQSRRFIVGAEYKF